MAGNFQDGNGDHPIQFDSQLLQEQLGTLVKWGAVVAGVIALFALLTFLRSVYADLLWFDNLGFRGVFVKVITTRIVLFLIGAITFAAFAGVSLYFAYRFSDGPITLPISEDAIPLIKRLTIWVSVGAAALGSVVLGAVLASRWEVFLRFTNSVPFNRTDPVFDKDLSFYVFTLPMLNFVQGWLLGAVILIALGSAALYFARFSLRGVSFTFTPSLKVHLSIIAAMIMLIIAGGHWLDRWSLLLSEHGAIFGAAYADVNARMPAMLILTIVALGSAILMLVNAYMKGARLLVGALALWIVMSVVLGGVWPSLMQQLTVNPNEFVREQPYIQRNIAFTRQGFGLDSISEEFFPAEPVIDADIIRNNLQTINNIRLWDYRPLSSVYRQIQLIRPYYEFKDADVDRYVIDGELRQVLLSAREVAPEKLQPESQTWTNTRLVYTHGIGAAMSPVTEFTTEGRPEFFAKDIPTDGVLRIQSNAPDSEPDILVTNPRIYYGENTLDYVIVNTQTDELDYQTEEGELIRTNYNGTGGVQLNSFIRRIVYAWEFADINILISGQIKRESRIQYRRTVEERINTVAPFLVLDRDPYIVATNNQFFWMQDAYTVTDSFPYSDPIDGGTNYMRNSVKVTMDAADGGLRFHIWDTSDPIVMTYAGIFPDLFVSKGDMSEELSTHVRYPSDLFRIQADRYMRYHMQVPQNFYNNEDLWAIAEEKFGQSDTLQLVEPYYVIMKLPGEEKEEFVLLIPYTPNERQNLVGWLAARSDGENYGKLVAFNFPKDRQVDGTAQVEARIDNDQDISAWFTLRCTEGSSCIRGNLLVIPLDESLLYAEPVYIQAEGIGFPELTKVILASGTKVVMEDSLEEALAALTGVDFLITRAGPDAQAPGGAEPTGPLETSLEAGINVIKEAIEGLRENLSQLEEAIESLTDTFGNQ
ncbi:MAG: UPF0182 family protein [Chloroflexi bacterium]|nr:UPF0182 family protein [Chloroflexota bacterium]MCI0795502.1 UPF0182 family protein [Chloroflexota bacterium]